MATIALPIEASLSTTEAAFLINVPSGGGVAIHGDTDGINPESELGGIGVQGTGRGTGTGVFGTGQIGVVGTGQIGVHASGALLAGQFVGDVEVTGDIRLTNADCAEDFDVRESDQIDPGTVVVLGEEGVLSPSQRAYDKRVAGVISGAGNYKPAIVLDKQPSGRPRKPVALLGKVYCKVDSQYGAIEVGDLLTTSPTSGHAMKAADPLKSFGAVIGKALRPFAGGKGLIPILAGLG